MALKRVSANCVLLVAKHGRTAAVLRGMAERIRQLAPKCEVLWEEHQRQRSSLSPPPPLPDLVISSGGDGTLLRAASYFPSGHAPTFLPVSGGSLGFMLPLNVEEAEQVIERIFKEDRPVRTMDRMRLMVSLSEERAREQEQEQEPKSEAEPKECRDTRPGPSAPSTGSLMTALNEVNIHRGSHPSLARIECAIDGTRLTSAIADGLLVATPTGSTAYSLSAGGPIVHPGVEGILLTPICPRSLSFRPALLPPTALITIRRHVLSRAVPLQLSIDGGPPLSLGAEATVTVTQSPHPLRVICRQDATTDWVHSVNSLLAWNSQFSERSDE